MQFIDTIVRNPVKVAVGVLLVVLFGTVALVRMPVELTPQVERPQMSIHARWNGAGPEEIEREIVTNLEDLAYGTSRSIDIDIRGTQVQQTLYGRSASTSDKRMIPSGPHAAPSSQASSKKSVD